MTDATPIVQIVPTIGHGSSMSFRAHHFRYYVQRAIDNSAAIGQPVEIRSEDDDEFLYDFIGATAINRPQYVEDGKLVAVSGVDASGHAWELRYPPPLHFPVKPKTT